MSTDLKRRNIPFSPPDMTEAEANEVRDAIVSGWITTGPRTKKLESIISEYVHTEKAICLNSATAAMEMVLHVLGVGPGDEVIIFAPFFGEYINYVNNFDGKIKIISADTKSFQPNLKELEKEITSKTKAIIINSPNNPSGVIYNENTIIKMSKILKIKEEELGSQIYLISDEPYREIIYDNAKVPCILNYYDNSFIGYSYSKSLSLPGERIGYVVVNSKIKDFKEMVASLNIANRILGFVNAPSLFQRVIKESLNLEVDSNIYKKNRDLLYNHLIQIGFECMKPEGTFYLFPKSPIDNDVKFCEDAKKFNILAVPGSTFGCPGYFRLSYCISYEKIEKSLKAFDNLMNLYKS